jgi:hypothetical protein
LFITQTAAPAESGKRGRFNQKKERMDRKSKKQRGRLPGPAAIYAFMESIDDQPIVTLTW